MASSGMAFLTLSMVLLCSYAMAIDHTVGDDKGWTLDFNYADWAKDRVFHVGDNLVFNYDNSKHNVLKVNGSQFQSCSFTADNAVSTSGSDVIPLKAEGKKWYICGKANHCAAHEMKLVINVVAPAPAPAPTSAAHSVVSSLWGALLMLAIAAIYA